MKYTFADLKAACKLYTEAVEGTQKQNLWVAYCEIRDALEADRKKLKQVLQTFDQDGLH